MATCTYASQRNRNITHIPFFYFSIKFCRNKCVWIPEEKMFQLCEFPFYCHQMVVKFMQNFQFFIKSVNFGLFSEKIKIINVKVIG